MATLLDELRTRTLAGTPRRLPWLVRIRVLLGGRSNQVGWALLGFGMIFYWAMVCHADLTSWHRFRGPLQRTDGVVTASSDTGASEGGSKHRRGTPIYKNDFRFLVDDREYRGASYAAGVKMRPGRAVTVEYVPGKPEFSRIQRMRGNIFSPIVLMVMVLPMAGIAIVLTGLIKGIKACRLLTNGMQTTAGLISRKATNTRVNRRLVYKFIFSFKAGDDSVHEVVAKTEATERFQDESAEPVVYDPVKPDNAVLLNNLPGMPHITEEGKIEISRPRVTFLVLLIPLATVLGHGIYAALKLLS